MKFVWVHGWAYDPTYFNSLIESLPQDDHITVNLGYYGQEDAENYLSTVISNPSEWTAVGHSFGFFWLLQQPLLFCRYISLNGFSCLSQKDDLIEGVPLADITALERGLEKNPLLTLKNFYDRCGGAPPRFFSPPNLKCLQRDLTSMRKDDRRKQLRAVQSRVQALISQNDGVISPVLQKKLFDNCVILTNESHSLKDLSLLVPFLKRADSNFIF